ncbi:MAG TPA: ParB/RepB/Spo0J family partition protein [Chloroflexota bacterium]|nr:ParB/RepB/Spo0J family partition protein [Chloroflexota bacterium]
MAESPRLLYLDPRTIAPDPDNVRRDGPGDLDALTASIRAHGLLQPVGVAEERGGYRIVYGNRRREAAIRAGLATIPCLPVDGTPEDRLVRQILENLQRQDLNDLDQAEGFARLRRYVSRQQPSLSGRALDDAVGQMVGLSGATVRRYLGLRELAPAVRDLIADGQLTVTQAQHLAAVDDPLRQEAVAQLAVERDLSAAAIARACRAAQARPNLSIAEAVEMAEQGVVPEPIVTPKAAPTRLPPRPRAEQGDDTDLWGPDEQAADEPAERRAPAGPTTADGNRRFRIRSVSAFCDEIDRLARCLQEGDLTKAAASEADAAVRLRLAARQLEYVQRELGALLQRQGWADEPARSSA